MFLVSLLLVSSAAYAQSDSPTVLITGSNRGIGFEFVKQYADKGYNVIATCRNPDKADDLNAFATEYDNVTV
jgi:NAD(P)-dependent dehydrogenase (short-subunit alcohol dehydrogenase family)